MPIRDAQRRLARRLLPACALLVVIGPWLAPAPVHAVNLWTQERSTSLSQSAQTIGYDCFNFTTPACPTVISTVPSSASELAPDFAVFDETVSLAIGDVSHASSVSPSAFSLSGSMNLTGVTPLVCFQTADPLCPYLVVTTYHSGSGSSRASIRFELEAPASIGLTGGFAISTTSYDPPGDFGPYPYGVFVLEVWSDGGSRLHHRAGSILSSQPSVQETIDDQIMLPAGVYRLNVELTGYVSSALFPGAAGDHGSDVTSSYAVDVTLGEQPVPVPSLGWLPRGLLAVMLCALAAHRPAALIRTADQG